MIGQPSFTSNTAAATASGLSDPQGIAFDSSGNLWVSDATNGRILEFTAPLSMDEAASLVLGEPNFTTSADPCFDTSFINAACISLPEGLAFDSSGDLWVSDSSQNRILEFKAPFSNDE
ncbi:MAG TPA: hypothetical protein VED17_03060, partial [Nitrososphaerales archaeon]|nr:hypothetical protein [Nitrososphaerales archaeon]